MLNSVTLVLTASMLLGQTEQGQPATKELLVFQPYIGKWVGEVTVDEDVPGLAKRGDQLPLSLTFSWTKNGRAVVGELGVTLQSGPADYGYALYTWDPQLKTIVCLDTSLDGSMARGEVTTKDGNLIFKFQGSKPDGTSFSSTITYKPLNEDSLRAQIMDRKEGDRALSDTTPVVLTRSKK